jgi:hypothetical protein
VTGNLIATGIVSAASLVVTSNVQVPNLNATYLQGALPSAFATTAANVFSGNQTIPGAGGVNAVIGDVGCSASGGISFMAANACNNYALGGNTTSTVINRPTGGSILFAEGNGAPEFEILAGGNTEVLGGTFTGSASATTGSTVAIYGLNPSTSGTGVEGSATAASGATTGILGQASSASGIAGVFNNTASGQILSGKNNGAQVFSVNGFGVVSANGGLILPVNGTGITFPNGSVQTVAAGGGGGGSGTVTSVGTGAGLTGGPITTSGTLSIATGGVSNAMLANNSLTIGVAVNGGLSGGGSVALGGSATPLSVDALKVPLLNAANTFTSTADTLLAYSTVANSAPIYGTNTGSGGALTGVNSSNTSYPTLELTNNQPAGTAGAYTFYAVGPAGSGSCLINNDGALTCSTVSPVVRAGDGRQVKLYDVASSENWFEDFGSGQLSGGVAQVSLDPTFASTVNTGEAYRVFLTPRGDCEGLYIGATTARGFEVRELHRGTSNVSFDYRIVAKRVGYESVRLEDVTGEETQLRLRLAEMEARHNFRK